MIKILHILSTLTISSGVASFVMNYYRNIDRDKVQFDFLYFEKADNEILNEIKCLGGNAYYIKKPSFKNCIKSYNGFNQIFQKHGCEYSAVHLHEVYLVHFINYFVKKYEIKHLITHAHTTKYSDNHINAIRNRIMCLGLTKVATEYFACSKAAGEFYYGKKAVKNALVKVIPNAIDLKKYKFNETIRNKVRKELNIEDKFVIGHIGRMTPQKNQKFLLKIFAELRKENDRAVLLIIGDGSLHNEIENEILNLALSDSVILLGVRKDIPALLMAMDVFVLPSLFEGLGIVVLEAQATGLQCILSDKVPKEVDCGLCKFVKLNAGTDVWCNVISKYSVDYRDYFNKNIEVYDIRKCVNNLVKEYLAM